MTERAPEEISKIPNLDGYRDTLDVSGFLPLGQTSPEQSRVNPTNYYSLGGTDLLDPQNSFISRANGDWNMSGFPNGSVILIPWRMLERRRHPALPQCHQWDWSLRLVRGKFPWLTPWIAIILAWECYPSQDQLQLVGSTSVDGALPDTTSPPIKARANTQVNRVPELFVNIRVAWLMQKNVKIGVFRLKIWRKRWF